MVRLTYCNPLQKHLVARGRAEEWVVFCVVSVSVSGPHEPPAPGDEGAGPPSTTTVMARGVAMAASLLVASLFLVGWARRLSKG